MRKIATLTPIWGQEMFIGPHFDQITTLDKNIVLIEQKPLGQYRDDHGITKKKDRSEDLIRKLYPKVEIIQDDYEGEYDGEIYNRYLHRLIDYDIVLRLDPDMLFMKEDWDKFISFIRNTDYDAYHVNFRKCSINYYITGSFNHGLKDAVELDPLGFSPKKKFEGFLSYPAKKPVIINWDNFLFHHFRGWNKPKSTPWNWFAFQNAQKALKTYGNNGKWFSCPSKLQEQMIAWQIKLEKFKKNK